MQHEIKSLSIDFPTLFNWMNTYRLLQFPKASNLTKEFIKLLFNKLLFIKLYLQSMYQKYLFFLSQK